MGKCGRKDSFCIFNERGDCMYSETGGSCEYVEAHDVKECEHDTDK